MQPYYRPGYVRQVEVPAQVVFVQPQPQQQPVVIIVQEQPPVKVVYVRGPAPVRVVHRNAFGPRAPLDNPADVGINARTGLPTYRRR